MSKRTLLLADDSVTIQKVVNLTFADEGIDVVTVGDGDSAMEKISEISPDVVLADVHMPGLSGYQICEIVRENPVTKDMPVVLLVGSFEPFDESEAARVGANAYLTKPFQSIRQLVSQVTDLMDLSEPTPEPVIPQVEPAASEPTESFSHQEPVADTGDIDSLYHQSFSDISVAEPEAPSTAPTYVDAGMDDEMIEANVIDAPYETEASEDLSSYDTDENIDAPAVEGRDLEADQAPEAQFGEPGQSTEEVDIPSGANAFDTLADDRAQAAAAASTGSSEFDEFSRTEQIPAFEGNMPTGYDRGDDSELLELPPIESGKTLEFTTTQRVMAEGGRELVSISPELMDMIVQKVVEKMSEKY